MIRKLFIAIVVCALAAESSSLMINRTRRSADTCGVPKIKTRGLIVNGQSFPRGLFPWIVALVHTGYRPPKFFCAGTLISKTFVISAAHCILQKYETKELLPRNVLASFGAHDLSDTLAIGRYQLLPKKIYLHDDWSPGASEYDADVALLEFETGNIHFNDFVQPICLWDLEVDPTVTDGIVVGWGKSEDPTREHENLPKLIEAPIQFNDDCLPGEERLARISSRRTFCAGLRNGSGVCTGDSGGGLFIKVNGVSYLRGIVSSSLITDDGCDVSKNAVYTNVLKFKDWIRNITATATKEITVMKKVFCIFAMVDIPDGWYERRQLSTCGFNQTIDSESFFLASPKNTSIEAFIAVSENKQTKFLPKLVGEKFPNLRVFDAMDCGLTIVRDFYFKNMQSLEQMDLQSNQIRTIEASAFDDLVSLTILYLHHNMIETLDEKLLVKMVKLEHITLNSNKIKFLGPTTFKIPGNGKLSGVALNGNVCIDEEYEDNLIQLESDLRANCTQ